MPAMSPLNSGALEANATPRQSGRATRKTTIDEGISAPKFCAYDVTRFIIKI
jgi:hypothetical protein